LLTLVVYYYAYFNSLSSLCLIAYAAPSLLRTRRFFPVSSKSQTRLSEPGMVNGMRPSRLNVGYSCCAAF